VEDIHILAGRYRGKPTVGPLFALAVGAGIQTDVPLAIRGVLPHDHSMEEAAPPGVDRDDALDLRERRLAQGVQEGGGGLPGLGGSKLPMGLSGFGKKK